MKTNKDLFDILTDRFDSMDIKLDKLGERVRMLEIWRGNIIGKITILTAGITLIGSLIITYIKDKLFKNNA